MVSLILLFILAADGAIFVDARIESMTCAGTRSATRNALRRIACPDCSRPSTTRQQGRAGDEAGAASPQPFAQALRAASAGHHPEKHALDSDRGWNRRSDEILPRQGPGTGGHLERSSRAWRV